MAVGNNKAQLKFPQWTIATLCTIAFFGMNIAVAGAKKKFRRDELPLKKNEQGQDFPVQVLTGRSGVDENKSEMIRDIAGNEYDLSRLKPFVGLFSDNTFVPSDDNTKIVDKRTGEVIKISIYRAEYEDGSTILVEKDEQDNIAYVEVRRPAEDPDTFLVPNEEELLDGEVTSEFLSFTSDDIDYELLQSRYRYGDVSTPGDTDANRDRDLTMQGSSGEYPFQYLDYRQGRTEFTTSSFSSFSFCASYTVVNLAIVYDGDFCSIHGGFEDTRRRIMTIVASASFHYERDMCVQLKLTDIATPEVACSPHSSVFEDYDREDSCGSDSSFLTQFSNLMRDSRDSLQFDPDATVHMFTGHSPPDGTIGCAFVGSFCNSDYGYGVEYMSFSSNPYSQGVVLAHEIGHVLNAPHLEFPFFYNHIMEPNINNAADGFNRWSIIRILSFLNSNGMACVGSAPAVDFVPATPTAPNLNPSPRPPTLRPSAAPSQVPSPLPTSSPTGQPTKPPDDGKCRLVGAKPESSPCIYTSTGSSQYACFQASSLLAATASPSCRFESPRIRILRCAGPLQSGFFFGSSRMRTRSCSASCVVMSKSLCFLASEKEQVYSVSFFAVADFDMVKRFTTEVEVKNNDATGSCETAVTSCSA
ncbi:expressed unknown protein [Seminavis robusta]|uniref:Peptidase M12B domain-containing protein n=1 Tax=Seminavis robusta TaxID=568900 RepID=A0A9N8H1U6_9STRA|nr:expressed unknown protein [Seminavis robusta]|eukprot:Sro23_g015950.1 n/a (642) ;mRNA; r:116023-118111